MILAHSQTLYRCAQDANFGNESVNNKILADNYAAKGDYKVYLPDFMLGKLSCDLKLQLPKPPSSANVTLCTHAGRSPPSWLVTTLGSIMQPGNYIYKP